MRIIADLHTHTIVSDHAYSTLEEMVAGAARANLAAIAITDHGPQMPDGANPGIFAVCGLCAGHSVRSRC